MLAINEEAPADRSVLRRVPNADCGIYSVPALHGSEPRHFLVDQRLLMPKFASVPALARITPADALNLIPNEISQFSGGIATEASAVCSCEAAALICCKAAAKSISPLSVRATARTPTAGASSTSTANS